MTAAGVGRAITAPARAADDDLTALRTDAEAIVTAFAGELKGELLAATKAGGPVNAIPVCNEKAPAIAKAAEDASGWTVARSSHKRRDESNLPDDDTAAVIAGFVAREAAGEVARSLSRAEIVEKDGRRVVRFVKAIPTAQPCLNCHGGDRMRGVFTLSKTPSEQDRGASHGPEIMAGSQNRPRR